MPRSPGKNEQEDSMREGELATSEQAFWAQEHIRSAGWGSGDATGGDEGEDDALFNLDANVDFLITYMGTITSVRRTAQELIEYIDVAKRMGNIAWRANRDESVYLFISKFGVKITDVKKYQVLLRISTHEIGSVIHHVDDGKHHLLVIERSVKDSPESSYYLYECQSEKQAETVSNTFKKMFETVHTKTTLENL